MLKKKKLLAVIFVAIIVVFFVLKTISFYPFLFQLIFNKDVNLKQTNSRVNILLLGIGGGNHEGPNLSDTIILASIDEQKNKISLISVPRDLWFPDLEGANKKINSAYAYGESIRKGGGLPLAEAAISKVTGQSIDYAVRVDFSGFVKAVDIVGGIDVSVDNTFDDYVYPTEGKETDPCGYSEDDIKNFSATDSAEEDIQQKFSCRYMHIHFDKGIQHMSGEQALEYVRSRHAIGLEGGDFARSKRQEKVINAFKNKILSAQTLINPGKILGLYNVLSGSIDTNIKQDEFDDFIRLAEKMRNAKFQSSVIDIGNSQTQTNGLLIEAPISADYDYLSVLIPRIGNGNFSEIKKYVSCEIETGNCTISQKPLN